MRMDGQRDKTALTKLIVALRNLERAPKKKQNKSYNRPRRHRDGVEI